VAFVDPQIARMVDLGLRPIPGLYVAGEMIGGIFRFNHQGGTRLMSRAVFGRLAEASAGAAPLKTRGSPAC
jgi:tricarballylate dehydrogenase